MKNSKLRDFSMKQKQFNRIKIFIYALLIVLINRTAAVFPYRLDLTGNKIHTLSPVSKEVLNNLEEPLILHIFLSDNLPPPYNNLNRDIRNLMESYSLAENRYFSYQIHSINGTSEDDRKLAQDYGIQAMTIQDIKEDGVKLISAWMGIAILQGERQLLIPLLDPEGNLEYKITSAIGKLTRLSGLLLGLKEDISIKISLSSALLEMENSLQVYPLLIQHSIEDINARYYNRLHYESATLQDNAIKAVMTITGNGRSYERDLIDRTSREFNLLSPEKLTALIEEAIPLLLGRNGTIGYLADHGTKPLYGENGIGNFSRLVSENYEIRPIALQQSSSLPPGLSVFVIAGATERFTSRELQILGEFLKNGGSLAIFYDSYKEILPSEEDFASGKLPEYIPLDTGLRDFLDHYNLGVDPAYVLDTESYKDIVQGEDGNLLEIPVYYAPEIRRERMDRDSPVTRNLKGLITINTSPIEIKEKGNSKDCTVLFSSSPNSWLMEENINLYDPLALFPPSKEERRSHPLAVLQEGRDGSGRIFLAGTSTYLEDRLIDQKGNTPNAMIVMNILDVLSGRENTALLRSKGQSYNPLNKITSLKRSFFKGFNAILLPLLAALSGLFALVRRRKRQKNIRRLFQEEP